MAQRVSYVQCTALLVDMALGFLPMDRRAFSQVLFTLLLSCVHRRNTKRRTSDGFQEKIGIPPNRQAAF